MKTHIHRWGNRNGLDSIAGLDGLVVASGSGRDTRQFRRKIYINTNTGVGSGFNQGGNLVPTGGGEGGSVWFVGFHGPPDATLNFEHRWITSKDADEFNPQTLPTRIEWQASYANVHFQRTIDQGVDHRKRARRIHIDRRQFRVGRTRDRRAMLLN